MTFVQCSLNVTSAEVFDTSILLTNPSFNAGLNINFDLPSTINYTDINANIDCGELGARYGTVFNPAARNACTSMIVQFGTFPILIGLLGTILLLGGVIFALVSGFVSFGGDGITKAGLFGGILAITSVGVLVIVAIVMFVGLCAPL